MKPALIQLLKKPQFVCLLIIHAVLLAMVPGCEAPQENNQPSTLIVPKDPRASGEIVTFGPDTDPEEIVRRLEDLGIQKKKATNGVSADTELPKKSVTEEELEALRRENEALQRALLAKKEAELAEAEQTPVVESPTSTPAVAAVTPIKTAPEFRLRIAGILPSPEGDDRLYEAVEVLNQGAYPVSMKGWVLRDLVQNSWKLDSMGFIEVGETKGLVRGSMNMGMNNDGDVLRLISPDGKTIDTFAYDETEEGVWIRREFE